MFYFSRRRYAFLDTGGVAISFRLSTAASPPALPESFFAFFSFFRHS
jgi:hypothetical protein